MLKIIPYENEEDLRQDTKQKYAERKRINAVPTTILKTYVSNNIRYWEEYTQSGIIVSITSKAL